MRSIARTTERKPRRMRSSSSESTASIAASISATQASAPRAVAVGVEARVEERDERAGHVGVPEQRLLHVAIAERDPDLAQVARDRAQHRHLAPVELGAEDQAVEAVELGLAVPDAPEALVEALADRVDVDLAGALQAEVVDPHGRAVARLDLVRPLVGDGQPEALEHRQDVGEQHAPVAPVELAAQRARRALQRPVEAEVERLLALHRLHPADVGQRRARVQVVAVGGRERAGVAAVQRRRRSPRRPPPSARPAARRPSCAWPRRSAPRARPGSNVAQLARAGCAACSGCAPAPTRSAAAPSRPTRRRRPPAAGRRSSCGWRC